MAVRLGRQRQASRGELLPGWPQLALYLTEVASDPAGLADVASERLRQPTHAVDVQLPGQVTSAVEWPKLLAHCERRNPPGVASWPRRLDSSAHALNLWPLPAGRVGRAAGLVGDVRKRQPKTMLSAPGLTVFDPEKRPSDATTALAVVCATWLEDVGTSDFEALRLAPPVLETWATGGRLLSRAVVDFDLEWSLPVADGI